MENLRDHPGPHGITALLQTHVEPFMAEQKAAGYAPGTLSTKRASLYRFLNWRRRRRVPVPEPDEAEAALFIRRACPLAPGHRCLARRALGGFLQYLRRRGLIAVPSAKPSAEAGCGLRFRYTDYLRNEKGLSERSIEAYLPHVDDFIGHVLADRRGTASIRRLDATLVRRFLLERARGVSGERVRLLAVSLRCFLRFLHAQGEIPADLTAAIPTVRRRTPPGIPGQLTPEEVERVLAAPDQACATGRRDRAILLLLARLGLRSREVLALELGDLRWRTGELLIRGKGSRQALLPLPQDVGGAVARYLRIDRGVHSSERVFLRANAPMVPLTGSPSIGHIVRRAMARAEVPRPGRIAAHLFLHTLASRMLQRGARLREIAEVLRHRAPSTTEIYAKIDLRSLSEVVRPWPIRGGAR